MSQAETDRLNQIVTLAPLSRAVCSIAELGIADLIPPGHTQSVLYLARSSKTHEPSLYRVLRFLASHGIFEETEPRHFGHTPVSDVLRTDAAGSYRAGARLFHHLFAGWEGLHHTLLTGEPGFDKVFGEPLFAYVGKHPELGPVFDAGMTSIHGYETGAMLDAYDFSDIGTLADIGGGNGSLLAGVLKRHPSMKGILFDLGHVVGRAQENLANAGVADRCKVIEGSFFETIPEGADAYLMRHVLHDWTDRQCAQILELCRKVIPETGRLLVCECVVPADNSPSVSKAFDMTMMVIPGGQERTEADFRALLGASGFHLSSVTPTSTMISIVEGRPAEATSSAQALA